MPDYETVSMCDGCRIVFPNKAIKSMAKDSKDRKERVKIHQSTIKTQCPDCGREISHLLDDGYWLRT